MIAPVYTFGSPIDDTFCRPLLSAIEHYSCNLVQDKCKSNMVFLLRVYNWGVYELIFSMIILTFFLLKL